MKHQESKHLVIRTDAYGQIGTGHLMRCLSLAQAWKDDGGQAIFVATCLSEGLEQRLKKERFAIHLLAHPYPHTSDWDETRKVLTAYPGAWMVLDGYHFDESYQKQVKDTGHKLLVIDDMAHLKHYYADIVLNQNLHAGQLHYAGEPYTRLLLGTKYVLLSRDFLAWKDWQREIRETAQRVLVTLGGTDSDNNTLKVIQALQGMDMRLEATVVIGASNPHADVLKAAIKESLIPIQLVHDASNMPELMAWADVAISSAGTTVWELALMGLPTIVGISAPIEEFLVSGLEKHGLFFNIGWLNQLSLDQIVEDLNWLIHDKSVRNGMSILGKHLVSGDGCYNVLKNLSN